jgi:hypothetical protein
MNTTTYDIRFYFDVIVIIISTGYLWYKRRELFKEYIKFSYTKQALLVFSLGVILLSITTLNVSFEGNPIQISFTTDFLFYKGNGGMFIRYTRSFGYLFCMWGLFLFALNALGSIKTNKLA